MKRTSIVIRTIYVMLSLFCKAILLTLPILIVLQDVSYALSPTSQFKPITDSEERLTRPPAAPTQAKTVSDVLKPQNENEPVPISFTLPSIASEQPGAVVFMPKRDFIQGRPLDTTIIRTTRSAEEAIEVLKNMPKEIELYIRGHLRYVDAPGSSLDLPEFQVKLTPPGNIDIEEVPSTPTLAGELSVTVRFELLPDEKDRDVIEYVAPDYGINPDNPYRVEGGIRLNPATKDTTWETTPKGQLDAPAYIFRNIFGLGGIRIICADTDAMALAGGMESSNVFNVALIAAASMLSGANLSQAEIFNLAVKLENNEFKGLTGGQGHLCCMMGGAWRHLWLSGMTDGSGKLINPYSALSIPFLSEEHFDAIEDHMFIVQAGKEYESGKPRIKRTAALINYMWTDLLRYGDPEGVNLHRQKIVLSARYTKALQDGNFEAAVTAVNRYVDIRDALCRRWLGLVIDYNLGRDVPDYVKAYFAPKVFDKSNEYYEFYDVVRDVIKNMDACKKTGKTGYEESARSISFYTYEGIGVLVKEARKEGIAIMPLGAGGPGANLIALSPNGSAHLRKFLESQGIEQFTPEKAEEAKKLIRGLTPRGEIKGYMPFKIGREPLQINGFDSLRDVLLPAGPAPLSELLNKKNTVAVDINALPSQASASIPEIYMAKISKDLPNTASAQSKTVFATVSDANEPPKDKPEEKRNRFGLVKAFLPSLLYGGEVSDLIKSLNTYRSANWYVIGRDAAWELSGIITNKQNNYFLRKKAFHALLTALKTPGAYVSYYTTIASCLEDIAKKDHNLAPTVISELETILRNPELCSGADAYTGAANTFSSLVVNNLIELSASLDICKIIYKSKKIEKSYIYGAVANALTYIALNSRDQKLVQKAVDLLKIALETSPSTGEISALTSIIQGIPDQNLSRGGIDVLEGVLKKKNLHPDVYRVTIESINSIAKNKPELITSATVSALSTVLKDLRLYRSYGIYINAADCLYSIARNAQDGDLPKEVITVLENILKTPGLYLYPDAYWLADKKMSHIAKSIPNSAHPSTYWAAAANLSLIANNAKDQVLAYQALSVLVSAISDLDLDSVIHEAAAHYLTQIKPELISSKKEEIYSVALKRISTTDRWLVYAAMLNLLNALGYETKNFSHTLDVYFPNATEKIQKDFTELVGNINHKYNNIIRVITVEECSFTRGTIMFGSDIDHLVVYYEKGRTGEEIIAAASDFARGLRNMGIEKGHDDYGGWVEESLERTGHGEIIIYNKGEINHSKEGILDGGAKTEAREKLFNVFNSGLSSGEVDLLRRIHGLGAIQELSGCRFVASTLFLTKETDTEFLEKLEEKGLISMKAPGITTIWNAGEGSGVIIAYRVVGLQSASVPPDRNGEKGRENGDGPDLSSPALPAVESDGDVLRQPDANTFTSQYMFEALKRYGPHLYAKELVKEEFKNLGEMLNALEEYLAKSGKTAGPPAILKMIDGKMHWSVSEEKIKGILKEKNYRESRIDLLIQIVHIHILYPAEKERLHAQIVAILAYLSIIYFDNLANPDNPAGILFIKQHLDMTRQDLIAIGPSAVSVLRHILNTADPEHMGRAVALALGLIDSPEAISVLVTALETAPEKARKWVVVALGLPESLPVNVVSTLIDMLETTIDDELRYALATTLCGLIFKHPEIIEKMERWMHNFVFDSDDNTWVSKGIRHAELPALWFEGSKDILRQRMPTLIRILDNPYCLARFLFVLSVFRTKFKYFIANDIQIPPIAYARQTGIRFKFGELRIVPISESYRRHIIYTEEDEDGRIFALEMKMPGQREDRNVIQETNFGVASELWKKYPSEPGVVKPLFFLRLNGQFPLYGRDIDFPEEEPLGIAGFEYEDGKRFRNIRDEFIEEIGRKKGRPFEEIMRSVVINILVTTIRIHHLGYRGSSDAGTDMHNENLRVLDNGRTVFVGDFGAFEYIRKVPWEVRREETAGLLGMFGPVVDWLLLGVIEKLTKVEPTKEARAQMASEAILELNRQEGLKSVMEILKKIKKGEEAISFADHSLSDIEKKILTMVKKQKKASIFSYFLSLFKSEIGIFVKRKSGDGPNLSSAALPIKNVSKENEAVPVSLAAPAHVETTKLAVELKDTKKSLREKLFAMKEAREALVQILDEIIKEGLFPGGFVIRKSSKNTAKGAQIKKLRSELTRANNPEDQKAIIAKVNFTMEAVRRIISETQNKVKDDEMKDILGMQRRYDEIRNELVKENQGLVWMLVKDCLRKLGKKWEDSEDLSDDLFQNDLFQIGNIGLISAIERFDPDQGFEFSTYAFTAISRAIENMVKQRLIGIPQGLWKEKSKIDKFIAKFTQAEKREPAVEEIAAGLNLPVSRVEKIFRAFKKPVFSENSFDEEDEEPPLPRLEYPSDRKMKPPSEDALIIKEKLGQVLQVLSEREREVIKLRYGLDGNGERILREVGEILEISHERVRQIESKALKKLRGFGLQPKGSIPLSRKDTNRQVKPPASSAGNAPIKASGPLKSAGAEDSRRLKPFFKKHELGFQNITAVIMAASKLKKLVIDKNAREGAIYAKIGKLNKTFPNGEIEIERQIKTGGFQCSRKEYKYAVFRFKKEDKTINVLFLEDHAALTSDELKELRIQDIEKRRLDCPGLEGVWFINSDAAGAKSTAEFEKLPLRDALEKEINRIHNENFKYIPNIPEKTILCHIIVDSILPEGQRAMLKVLEQNMRDKSYSEKVASLTIDKQDNFIPPSQNPALNGRDGRGGISLGRMETPGFSSESFIGQLRALMARQRELYKDCTVNFDVACPNTDLVAAILGANLGIKALAFEPCKEADVAQVEGIILALRALNSGKIETLREAFKILAGKELPWELSGIADIDELIKRITFILPAAKVIDYSRLIRLNEIIRKNIEAAA